MPLPSVEPMPPVPAELRFSVPLEAQEASYLAASERTASLRRNVSAVKFLFPIRSPSDNASVPHLQRENPQMGKS